MGLLGPSAVEHTTGVVFRVGTPGRLAGRCLWPSLSSRKSKATGVVAVPFSSISPLHHLLRFFTSLLLPSFLSSLFSLAFSPVIPISCSVFIHFGIFLLSHVRVVSVVGLTSLNFFSGMRVVGHTRVSGTREGVVKAAIVTTVHVSK